MENPYDITLDSAGNIYIAAAASQRIRKVTVSTGIITTFAGTGSQSFSGDGGAATSAALYYPAGLAVDLSDNVYISDKGNYRVRKVTASTGIITTFAGTGSASYSGDNGPATSAALYMIWGLDVDSAGNSMR
jgi:hypothetical protein